MTESLETYQFRHQCSRCEWFEDFELSRRDAAFWILPSTRSSCPNCSSKSFSSSLEQTTLTPELLMEWATENGLHVSDQDEENILAEPEHIDPMLQILDQEIGLPHKRSIIIQALCVMVYDRMNPPNRIPMKDGEETIERVLHELTERKSMVIAHREMIMDYVKKVVFPKLGIAI